MFTCTSWRRFASVVILSLAAAGPAWGIPSLGEQFQLEQPDGTWVAVRIWGDEYYGVTESLDGYTLVRDPQTQFMCYAYLSADGNDLLSTGVPVGEPLPPGLNLTPHLRIHPEAAAEKARAARAQFEADMLAEAPGLRNLRSTTTGNVNGITLIVQFPDVPGTIPPSEVNNFCNQVGYNSNGNNGSVRDYFFGVSNGALTYQNFVPTAYYTAANPRSHYTDESITYGTRARQLIVEALSALNSAGFDFSQYDSNGDGLVDALNCFYAGHTVNNWAKGLWPHASAVAYCADGVCTGRYQITSMGSALTLGTFCHENGHMLMGWPDLYDYDGDSAGAGRYCLMAYPASSTNPQEPNAYFKYQAGWSTPIVLGLPQSGLELPSAGSNAAYVFPHPISPFEFYFIENRLRTGRDAALPDTGMAIWHVDVNGSNNNQAGTPASHYHVALIQADGDRDLEENNNSGDSTDLFGGPAYPACTPSTVPNTNWWSGASSGLAITNISSPAGVMTFDFANVIDCNNNGIADHIEIAANPSLDCQSDGTHDLCQLAGNDCNDNDRPDECDLPDNDCNASQLPDDCELVGNDCDINFVPDECDVAALTAVLSAPQDQTVCAFESATFTVQGPPGAQYRWYRGATPLVDGGSVSGATSSTLVLDGVEPADAGSYRCQVSLGCIAAFSPSATLSIAPATLSATQQPVAVLQLCAGQGQSAAFEFRVSNELGVSYQWFRDGEPLVDDGRISGAQTNRVLIASAAPADAGTYTCRAINACGASVESDPTRGKLNVGGAAFLLQPQATCATPGGAARFHARVDAGDGTQFFWYRNGEVLSDGVDPAGMLISGASTPTLTLENVPAAYNGNDFQLVTFLASPTCIGQSDVTDLAVGSCGPCRYAGDLDGDLDVDLRDLAAFWACFGQDGAPGGPCECANLDASSGDIDLADWAAAAGFFEGPW